MNAKPLLSWTLVAIQFLALAIFVVTGPVIASPWPLLLLELAGMAIIGWAIWSVRRSIPNVLPDVRPNAILQRHGPYRWIRHPMYAGLLLITLALLLTAFSSLRLATWLLLATTLLTKLRYEETLLLARFPDYSAYQRTSKRLIPFIY